MYNVKIDLPKAKFQYKFKNEINQIISFFQFKIFEYIEKNENFKDWNEISKPNTFEEVFDIFIKEDFCIKSYNYSNSYNLKQKDFDFRWRYFGGSDWKNDSIQKVEYDSKNEEFSFELISLIEIMESLKFIYNYYLKNN